MNGKGLNQLPSPVRIFIVCYMVLIAAGLLISLWIVLKSPILRSGAGAEESIRMLEEQIRMLKEQGLKDEEQTLRDEVKGAKAAQFYSYLKLAHIHHLGHIFMVFSVAGIYAFTRVKDSLKIQIIVWTTIFTLIHTLAFLIYSRTLLVVFGSMYGIFLTYMMVIIVIDCYVPVREKREAETEA